MKYKVYQNLSLIDCYNLINNLGWEEAAKRSGGVAAAMKCDVSGSSSYDPSMFEFYSYVADIEASDPEEVFSISNRGDREELVDRKQRMKSVSVGDIIIDPEGKAVMVDMFGFSSVNV